MNGKIMLMQATERNNMAVLDDTDRQLILATQDGLPLVPRPYAVLANKLGIPVGEVMQRMQRMLDTGVIRRIAAVPNHYKLGYIANAMSVWNVPDERVENLGKRIGALEFVSHCYRRPRHLPEWPYNLFAMVHATGRDEALEKVAEIARLLGADDRGHDILFSRRILKKTGMRLIP